MIERWDFVLFVARDRPVAIERQAVSHPGRRIVDRNGWNLSENALVNRRVHGARRLQYIHDRRRAAQ